jgi:hypothetical protein
MDISMDGLDLRSRMDRELVLRFSRFDTHPVHHVPSLYFLMTRAETGEELGARLAAALLLAQARSSFLPSLSVV